MKNLLEIVKFVKPTAIIGCAAIGQVFNKELLETMANLNERPIVFALSNPTSKAECTAEEAYTYTNVIYLISIKLSKFYILKF